jgi:5-methylcytosine-specific restriction endonuclease McrA
MIFTGLPFEIDHIIGESHGGPTSLENLAFACAICNHFKQAHLAAYLPDTEEVVKLFHPRKNDWSEHF